MCLFILVVYIIRVICLCLSYNCSLVKTILIIVMLRIDFSFTSLKYLFSLTSEGRVAPHGSEGTQTGTWTGGDLHRATGNRTCLVELDSASLAKIQNSTLSSA